MRIHTDQDNWTPAKSPLPQAVQVLTAWLAQAGDEASEFLVGVYVDVLHAQYGRSTHQKANPGEYDYCIEPWIVEGTGKP